MYLKSGEINIEKKEFHQSKNSTHFNLIDTNKISLSVRFELAQKDKYYILYKNVKFVRPFCIILPQMSEFIKCSDGNRKSMPFLSEDEEIMIK